MKFNFFGKIEFDFVNLLEKWVYSENIEIEITTQEKTTIFAAPDKDRVAIAEKLYPDIQFNRYLYIRQKQKTCIYFSDNSLIFDKLTIIPEITQKEFQNLLYTVMENCEVKPIEKIQQQ